MGKDLSISNITFFFCDGSSCQKAGSEKVVREARAVLKNTEQWDTTHTVKTRCNGRCEDAPTCIVHPGDYWYKNMTPEKAVSMVKKHVNNQEPEPDDLLFKKDWDKVASDNERGMVKPKEFRLVEDETLGLCYLTKGFSSDQHLYPLFLFIAQHTQENGSIKMGQGEAFHLNEIIAIYYEELYALDISLKEGEAVKCYIGNIPSTESETLVQQKISSTEYFVQEKTGHRGVRFKNRKGVEQGLITLVDSDSKIWEYCLKIPLQGLVVPAFGLSYE